MTENKVDIVKDTAILTTISDKVLRKLIEKSIYCISDALAETRIQHKHVLDLDIGIGVLSLNLSNNSVQYKFVPSDVLETVVRDTYIRRINLLENTLEESLVNKVTNTYKELF